MGAELGRGWKNQESVFSLTWASVSTPLLVALAFLVLVMLRGSSPNLKARKTMSAR